MKVQQISTIQYRYNNVAHKSSSKYSSPDFLGKVINNTPKSIQKAISSAIESANLKGRDKLIIPRAMVMAAKNSAKLEFHTSISNLNLRQWEQLAKNTLANLGQKNMSLNSNNSKTKTFLEYFIAYLK